MSGTKFQEMSLIEHITELRRRLLWSFVYILIIFIILFDVLLSLSKNIFYIIMLVHLSPVAFALQGARSWLPQARN